MVKKAVMIALWRVQQAQMVISIVFWSLTLTGVFYPYVRGKWFDSFLGPERVLEGMVIMFLLVIGLIVMFGLVYDKFKFWREQNIVIQERNPYTYGSKMWPQNIIFMWALMHPEDEKAVKIADNMLMHNMNDTEMWEAWDKLRREVEP